MSLVNRNFICLQFVHIRAKHILGALSSVQVAQIWLENFVQFVQLTKRPSSTRKQAANYTIPGRTCQAFFEKIFPKHKKIFLSIVKLHKFSFLFLCNLSTGLFYHLYNIPIINIFYSTNTFFIKFFIYTLIDFIT